MKQFGQYRSRDEHVNALIGEFGAGGQGTILGSSGGAAVPRAGGRHLKASTSEDNGNADISKLAVHPCLATVNNNYFVIQ